MTTDGGL
jgi:hypothetical protein